MFIRVYDGDGLVTAELDTTQTPKITSVGALIAELTGGGRYVCNPRVWHDLIEYPDRAASEEEDSLPAELAAAMARRNARGAFRHAFLSKFNPGTRPPARDHPPAPAVDLDTTQTWHSPKPDPTTPNPWPAVVREAPSRGPLSVVCTCKDLRCPVLLPRFHQCVYGIGHEPVPSQADSQDTVNLAGHAWVAGGWPYGPDVHHPQCPRNPEYRNPLFEQTARAASEGQPDDPAGITEEPAQQTGTAPIAGPWLAERI